MTSPSAAGPTLVLVHSTWHWPWVSDRLDFELGSVTTRRIAIPSVRSDPVWIGQRFGDLYVDADTVRSVVAGVWSGRHQVDTVSRKDDVTLADFTAQFGMWLLFAPSPSPHQS